MERELWLILYQFGRHLDGWGIWEILELSFDFEIALVYLWAAIHKHPAQSTSNLNKPTTLLAVA
jgi:hypothetical protein